MAILDSGERREFETGAVRDIQEGKGRCDLLPLDVVGEFFGKNRIEHLPILAINVYVRTGDTQYLYDAIREFISSHPTWDDVTATLEVAKHYEDGANKYAERNWEKGINLHCYIDSGLRHYLKWLRGDEDEPHDRAFLWNMFGAIWTHEHKPELIDLPFKENDYESVTHSADC